MGSEESFNISCKCCLIWAVTIAVLFRTIFNAKSSFSLICCHYISNESATGYPVYSHWCALYIHFQCGYLLRLEYSTKWAIVPSALLLYVLMSIWSSETLRLKEKRCTERLIFLFKQRMDVLYGHVRLRYFLFPWCNVFVLLNKSKNRRCFSKWRSNYAFGVCFYCTGNWIFVNHESKILISPKSLFKMAYFDEIQCFMHIQCKKINSRDKA